MTVAVRRSSPLASPPAQEIVEMFVARNPERGSEARRLGRTAAAILDALVKLPAERRGELTADPKAIRELVRKVADRTVESLSSTAARSLAGEGLAAPLAAAEAGRRLDAYAKPTPVEDWAGPVAGSTVLERDYGIARSTLHQWQQQGAVIGLLKGTRHHSFPLAQFIDGRPVEGVRDVLNLIGTPRTAWLWLMEPHPELDDRPPLEVLKAGGLREVRDLAARDYGQP